ncbi:8302_t:CDS:2, partial [Gigaspora rosea]
PTKPKETLIDLKESLKIESNKVDTIELNIQITEVSNVGNLKLQDQNKDGNKIEQVDDKSPEVNNKRKDNLRLWSKNEISNKPRIETGRKENHIFNQYQNSTNIDYIKEMNENNQQVVRSKINSPVKKEFSKIEMKKDDTFNLKLKDTQSIEYIENNTSTKEEYQKSHQDKPYQRNLCRKDEHEAFKGYKRLIKLNKETQVKNKLETFSYYQNSTKMEHINETIECHFKIEANIGPDIINDLEQT